jgi:hypothetical protein
VGKGRAEEEKRVLREKKSKTRTSADDTK